jgi:hypothetical protein
MVTTGNGELVLISSHSEESIYKFSCNQTTCDWIVMEQQLATPRSFFVAMLIPDNLTNCTKT